MERRGTLLGQLRSKQSMLERYAHARRSCPLCGDTALRVPWRVIDRVYSLFRPVQRYQCTSLECGWQGNLARGVMLDEDGLAPLSTPTGSD
jgi:hypothetical protein